MRPNVPAQRPRASGAQHGTKALSRGSVQPVGSAIQSYSTFEHLQSLGLLVMAHDAVVAKRTYETSLLSVMRASMHMVLDTICKQKSPAQRLNVKEAVKVNALSAVLGPSRTTECLSNPTSENRLLKCSEVLACHDAEFTPNDPLSLAPDRHQE